MSSHETISLGSSFEDFHRAHRDRLVASLSLHLGDLDVATDAARPGQPLRRPPGCRGVAPVPRDVHT